MYPTDLKNGQLKLNTFGKQLDHNIMLKTIQNFCYNKSSAGPFNMTSPFLVDNILHQQKTELHSQYINQQIENYVRQNYERSRENTPEMDESKLAECDEERQEESIEDSKIEDDDSKSRDDDYVKNEVYYNNDYYPRTEEGRPAEKEVLNVPNLIRRCQTCGSYDCPPFSCKKSGIRRLEELEKRFNLNYHENSGDEADKHDGKGYTDELVRSCDEYSEQKKPLLKFSVSAILGEDSLKSSNVNGELFFFL